MLRLRKRHELQAEMNLTNLIDVIFAILVVFMITAPLMSQGIKVDLPKAQSASMDEKKSINITITKEREIIINETPSDPQSFRRDFRQAWQGDDETIVVVNADSKVPYGFVMTLVAAAQKEGAKRLGFLTDPSVKMGGNKLRKVEMLTP